MTALFRWALSLEGVRWIGGMAIACLVIVLIRQNDTNARVNYRLDCLTKALEVSADSNEHDHTRILDGIYRIERSLEGEDGRRSR